MTRKFFLKMVLGAAMGLPEVLKPKQTLVVPELDMPIWMLGIVYHKSESGSGWLGFDRVLIDNIEVPKGY